MDPWLQFEVRPLHKMALIMTMLTKTQADYREMNPWLQFVVRPLHKMALIMTMFTKTQADYKQMNPYLQFVVRLLHQMVLIMACLPRHRLIIGKWIHDYSLQSDHYNRCPHYDHAYQDTGWL